MNRFDNIADDTDHQTRVLLPPAVGQVVIMAFEESREIVTSLDNLNTVLIIKPNAKFDVNYFKFPGGMLKINEHSGEAAETFKEAAARELREETGVIASQDPKQLFELWRTTKRRHGPHDGEFDIAFFAAFDCDFKERKLVGFEERGDEFEESSLARFGDIATPGFEWDVEGHDGMRAAMFPFHLQLLEEACKR